jgi:hypothetical protein
VDKESADFPWRMNNTTGRDFINWYQGQAMAGLLWTGTQADHGETHAHIGEQFYIMLRMGFLGPVCRQDTSKQFYAILRA